MSTLNLIFKFMTSFGSKTETHMTPNLLNWTFQPILLFNPYPWISEKKIQKPGTELASFLEKNPTKIQKIGFWELS